MWLWNYGFYNILDWKGENNCGLQEFNIFPVFRNQEIPSILHNCPISRVRNLTLFTVNYITCLRVKLSTNGHSSSNFSLVNFKLKCQLSSPFLEVFYILPPRKFLQKPLWTQMLRQSWHNIFINILYNLIILTRESRYPQLNILLNFMLVYKCRSYWHALNYGLLCLSIHFLLL